MARTISTNDNAMMMNFRDVMISNDMRWNFADEMTAILDKMNSKDGATLANFSVHVKGGKVTKINDSIVKQSVTVKMLMPYAMEEGKRRFEVFIENGEVSSSSAGNILSYVLEKMYEMQNQFNDIKRFGADSMGVQMDMDLYPMLKNIYENYGVEDMDRRFAEFSDYLISLGAVDPMLEKIVDEVFDELNPNFDKWAAGEDVDSGFGDDYMVKNDTPKLDTEDADVAKNDTPRLETETAEDAPILAYEEVKFWAEQFDLYNLYMGEENRHVEYRCAVEDNWYEYLLRGWNIDVVHTKEYWDKFWKIYCNVMHDLWGEEYNIAVDNIHDQLIFTPMINENDAPKFEVDEDAVYGVVEQLCTDMEEQMIECGDFMIGYKYAEPDFQGRPAEWFEDMIFVTKKSDLDEDGDYVWDDCEAFRIGDYFTYVVEILRGDFDVIAEIKDAIVEYMENNNVA